MLKLLISWLYPFNAATAMFISLSHTKIDYPMCGSYREKWFMLHHDILSHFTCQIDTQLWNIHNKTIYT